MSEDYYELLGVEPDASEEAILQAYREKAAEHHPDVSEAADAEATFQRLNRAKDVLTDAERRRRYDRVGHDRFVEMDDGGGRHRGSSVDVERGADQPRGTTSWPLGLRTLFERSFPGHGHRETSQQFGTWSGRHDPGRAPFDVDLTERFRGPASAHAGDRPSPSGDRGSSAASTGHRPCPTCRGRGSFVHDIDTARGRTRRIERCEQCGGSGSVPE